MDDNNSNLEITISRSGHPVPQIGETFLHSVYNPVKEANSFADAQLELIKKKPNILVLGLGFGYHIQEIINLQKLFYQNHKIVVVEPNAKLVAAFKEQNLFQVEIFTYATVKEYFEDIKFANYLTQKPTIIKHDPSFNTSKDFYVSFLTYRAPKTIKSFYHLLNPISKSLITDNNNTIEEALMSVSEEQHIESKSDFLLFALDSISRSAQNKI